MAEVVINDKVKTHEEGKHTYIGKYKGKDFKVTVSCGIAEFNPETVKIPADLIKIADLALYKAKHEGRNRTIVGKS